MMKSILNRFQQFLLLWIFLKLHSLHFQILNCVVSIIVFDITVLIIINNKIIKKIIIIIK